MSPRLLALALLLAGCSPHHYALDSDPSCLSCRGTGIAYEVRPPVAKGWSAAPPRSRLADVTREVTASSPTRAAFREPPDLCTKSIDLGPLDEPLAVLVALYWHERPADVTELRRVLAQLEAAPARLATEDARALEVLPTLEAVTRVFLGARLLETSPREALEQAEVGATALAASRESLHVAREGSRSVGAYWEKRLVDRALRALRGGALAALVRRVEALAVLNEAVRLGSDEAARIIECHFSEERTILDGATATTGGTRVTATALTGYGEGGFEAALVAKREAAAANAANTATRVTCRVILRDDAGAVVASERVELEVSPVKPGEAKCSIPARAQKPFRWFEVVIDKDH